MLKPDVIVRDGDQAFIAEAKNYAKPEVAHTDTHVVTLDSAHADNTAAPVYNVKAAANYLAGYDSQEQVEQLDVISFPRFMVKGGEHAVFPVIGDSMEPTFLAKDYVLCRKIPQSDWQYVNDLTVCVVVSKPHGLQLKRVKVRPDEHLVRCKSDNRRHHSFNLDFAEVVELWRFEWRLTANAENITEDIFLKVDRLEDNLEDLRQTFQSLVAASNVPLVRAGRNNPAQ
ncbi:S24 family peptidase [Solirubrum puertoriconensis]|uniref:Peptidase S24/S26A/S26B/S26C domain-containing protein n=1 Tax=Solirubrum puertoriconensis TaxID=1751427 RepID=A0A9X0HJ70_SOLP1|nr:S24/S26 family peptidase [Solirubrum puertoriconensis]KUG06910.1 hypothetical protein ASU33_06185 [Solirubrum puertoriconensis]